MDGETAMDDTFEKRVRAAAVAGWWTLLIAAGFLAFQWIAYLLVISTRPAWLPSLWGPDLGWQAVECVVLGDGDLQALLVVTGIDCSLADLMGKAIEKPCG